MKLILLDKLAENKKNEIIDIKFEEVLKSFIDNDNVSIVFNYLKLYIKFKK